MANNNNGALFQQQRQPSSGQSFFDWLLNPQNSGKVPQQYPTGGVANVRPGNPNLGLNGGGGLAFGNNMVGSSQASQNSPSPVPTFTAPVSDSPQGQDFDNAHRALDNANANFVAHGVDPFTLEQRQDPLQRYLDMMNTQFQFDPNSVDTTWVDNVLKARNQGLDQARGLANNQFNTSDQAIASMGDQYRNAVLSRQPQIQQQFQDIKNSGTAAMDKIIADRQAQLAANRAADEEMYQRLGIQRSANQPDLSAQEIQRGINNLQSGNQAHQAELDVNNQNALNVNNAAANAMLGQAQIGRQQLNMRLQDILGQLGQKQADYAADAAQQRAQWTQQMYGNALQAFQNNRTFAQDEYNKLLELQQQKAIADERYGPNSAPMLRALYGSQGAANAGMQGIQGLNSVTAPNTQADYYDVLAQNGNNPTQTFNPNNIANIANKAREMEKSGKLRGKADDVIRYAQQAAAMANQRNVYVDGTQ